MSEYTGKKTFPIHRNDAGSDAYRDEYVRWLQAEVERLRADTASLAVAREQLLDEIVHKILTTPDWVCSDREAAMVALMRVVHSEADDDERDSLAADLVGCLMDEIDRLRAELEERLELGKEMQRRLNREIE